MPSGLSVGGRAAAATVDDIVFIAASAAYADSFYEAKQLTDKVFLCRVMVYLVAIIWGAIQAWNYRFELFFGDSQQYFDMADYYSRGEFAKAVSLYWSPLYPMIAGLMFKLFPPQPYWAVFQFKFVNFVFLIATFLSYEFFFKQFYRYYIDVVVAGDPDRQVIDRNTLLFCGYALLVLFALAFGGVHQDTPDMINAALFFLSSGFLLKQLVKPTKLDACLFGITLGIGYFCKAIMFAMSLIYIGLNFVFKRNIACILITTICFALVAAPWVWTMSNKVGKFSIGESAKFVYINLVEERDPLQAEGLVHPPRIIHTNPLIREYGDEVPGTCPFLYDLGYWTYGAVAHVKINDLIKVIASDLLYYFQTFLYIPCIILGYVAIAGRTWPLPLKSLWKTAPIWTPTLGLCAQYALVNNVFMIPYIDRYFIAAYPIAMLGILIAIRIPNDRAANLIRRACLLTTILCVGIAFSTRFAFDVAELFKEKHHIWYDTAMALKKDGIKYGDRVAQLGGRLHRNTQFTEPEKLRITASVLQEELFWQQSKEQREEVMDALRKVGIRAVVYARIADMEDPLVTKDLKLMSKLFNTKIDLPFKNYPEPTDLTGWKQVPGAEIYYYLLAKPSNTNP
ncbi:MAG: hypothetical protein SGJ27_07695 [Candidatus Melainabacteria bacterium]|nr:hypothetical protein [Candidatus Melainabacteria bacterium]